MLCIPGKCCKARRQTSKRSFYSVELYGHTNDDNTLLGDEIKFFGKFAIISSFKIRGREGVQACDLFKIGNSPLRKLQRANSVFKIEGVQAILNIQV